MINFSLFLVHVLALYTVPTQEANTEKIKSIAGSGITPLKEFHELPWEVLHKNISTGGTRLLDSDTYYDRNTSNSCPMWSIRSKDGQCHCGDQLRGIVTCNNELNTILIHTCYCMTYDANGNGPFVGKCFYSCSNPASLANGTSDLIAIPLNASNSTLNNIFCSYWNREGILCGVCKSNHAPRVYSYDLRCVPCNPEDMHINILKYILAALLGPTIFLLLILCFRIKITSGKLSAFIFFSQVVSAPPMVRAVLYSMELTTFSSRFIIFSKLLFSFYGIWNLDFFRPFLPVICFSVLNTRQALGLDIIIAVYPLILLIIMYILIYLYDRNYRPCFFVWKPFLICFTRCRQIWNIRNSVVDTFAAFVILSYNKILNFLFEVYNPIQLYTASGTHRSLYSYYDPTVPLFSNNHISYVILSIVLFFFFSFLPIIFLCLYPTKCGRRCLSYSIRGGSLQIFSDAFQGYYKDGGNGTRDLRFFPAIYLISRIALFLIYSATLSNYSSLVMTVYLMATAAAVLLLQPYKQQFAKYNKIDAVMILILAMLILSTTYAARAVQTTMFPFISAIIIAVTLSLLPPLYIAILLIQWFIQRRKSVAGTYKALINQNE